VHYRTDGAELEPKPQRRIPVWLGTFGPRALAVTGRLADGWIPSFGYAPPERVVGMRERVLAAARAAGRDPAAITCAYNVAVRIDERAGEESSMVAGGPDAVAGRLLDFVRMGFPTLNLIADGPDQVERLAREVIPAVRAGAASR
jgi:alkanesulfonate monooxygenase SsuD/methylene tetrahydromethanopterin reductase-like flavin-dependent oxidoreductase (luciferase family)